MTAASGGPQPATGAAGVPPELLPGLRWRRVFPGEERELGRVRRWLASLLPERPGARRPGHRGQRHGMTTAEAGAQASVHGREVTNSPSPARPPRGYHPLGGFYS